MKAIRVEQFGGPEVLKLVDAPLPQSGRGEVPLRSSSRAFLLPF
jgi:NADPH:quinone reductase-like Zn-dependent oxidoreductase